MEIAASPDGVRYGIAEIDALYRTAPIGLCVVDRDLRFVRINERFAQMTGVPAAEHVGRTVRDLLPTLADQSEPLLRRVLTTGEAIVNIELHGQTAALPGVERAWMDNFAPITDSDGRVVAVNISVEEVTELRVLQEEQRQQEVLHGLAGALHQAREDERNGIARELHDDLGQLLTITAVELREAMNAHLPPEVAAKLESARNRLTHGLDTVRRISQRLRPAILDVVGLSAAIGEQVAEFRSATAIEIQFAAPPHEPDVSSEVAIALFRILQEALTNVARHSGASRVDVRLREEGKRVVLAIQDNGAGLQSRAAPPRGMGLPGMKERMRALGGVLEVASAAGSGTRITASVPRDFRGCR
jgi:PAS domain S-box-containing protein